MKKPAALAGRPVMAEACRGQAPGTAAYSSASMAALNVALGRITASILATSGM